MAGQSVVMQNWQKDTKSTDSAMFVICESEMHMREREMEKEIWSFNVSSLLKCRICMNLGEFA